MAIPGFSLARRLHAGETVFSGWCGLPYPLVAETLARDGFPAVAIESQHGLWDVASILAGISAVRLGGAAPIVRVPLNDFAMVSRALDFGAEGIIAPMINTPADAKAFAAAAKFPPMGERSWGPHRAMALGGVSDMALFLREANDHVITLAMIETRTALQNFESIINTPGIDGFFLGPSDLSIALSNGKTVDPGAKEVDEALDMMIAGAQKAKKDSRRFLPHGRTRARAREARCQVPHGIERSEHAARRRRGLAQDHQGVSAPGCLGLAGQHPRQRAVAPDIMVRERRDGVNAGEDEQRIGKKIMDVQDASRRGAVGRPGRMKLPQPKHG